MVMVMMMIGDVWCIVVHLHDPLLLSFCFVFGVFFSCWSRCRRKEKAWTKNSLIGEIIPRDIWHWKLRSVTNKSSSKTKTRQAQENGWSWQALPHTNVTTHTVGHPPHLPPRHHLHLLHRHSLLCHSIHTSAAPPKQSTVHGEENTSIHQQWRWWSEPYRRPPRW